ncbi:hypothetical protein [Jejubacter calystegiae]|uniref:hypothetical protein n=1 Tax=Jejubacter calystegiae TaxID=2579935 RepID=UPI00143CC973|nr:hypothetical protein [Jejubacter calystegiae]
MNDRLFESLTLQRIDLVARLVADSHCGAEDKDLALCWIAELTTRLLKRQLQNEPDELH